MEKRSELESDIKDKEENDCRDGRKKILLNNRK